MNTFIKNWLDEHHACKQWLWFVALWLAGMLTMAAIAYPLKLLIKMAS